MAKITIDGREIQAPEGATILEVARANHIHIPTLCHNEALPSYGACRLCLVEITTPNGRKRLVTSCLYPAEEGLKVRTESEEISRIRKVLIQLLMARCPESEAIRDMAREMGVTETPFRNKSPKEKCVLCGLCARACEQVVGVSAISLVNRGVKREIATPFHKDYSPVCIGCGSCAYICPTGAITVEDIGGKRLVKWPRTQMEFKMKRCRVCGNYWAPERQIEHIAEKSGTPVEDYEVCPDCRK